MNMTEKKSARLGDSYYQVDHPSGLRIYVYPKEGYHSTYAIFGTKYGSINTTFRLEGEDEPVMVPDGIAHYLEHKLFESEDGDAFARYAKPEPLQTLLLPLTPPAISSPVRKT